MDEEIKRKMLEKYYRDIDKLFSIGSYDNCPLCKIFHLPQYMSSPLCEGCPSMENGLKCFQQDWYKEIIKTRDDLVELLKKRSNHWRFKK